MIIGMTLRPQLEAIKKRADITRELASRRLYRLSSEQLLWKSSPNEWSIAQILNHLNLTHSKVIPNFEEALHTGTMAEHEREWSAPLQ
jgi:DinB superfamily